MKGTRYISLLLSTCILLGPTASFAQDGFDFGAEVDEEAPAESDENSSDSFEFSEEDLQQNDSNETKRAVIGVLALPGPLMTPQLRTEIEAKMNEVLKDIPSNLYIGSEPIVEGLKSRGLVECYQRPICLGNVALNNRAEQLLIATLTPTPTGGQTLTIDLFDAIEKQILRYRKAEGLKTNAEIIDAVKPLLYYVFKIREKRTPTYTNESSALISPIISWSSLGLALGAAASGGYFTYRAASADKELIDKVKAKSISQVEAQKINESIKQDQTISFVFYGLAAGLAAVSITFFALDVGTDISSSQEASIHNLQIAPILSQNSAGLLAGFSF